MTDQHTAPRTVVVTGGAGFIGAAVCRALVARGDRVRVIDTGEAAGFGALSGLPVELVVADVAADRAAVARTVEGAAAIVHLAAQASVPRSIERPTDDFRANVVATVEVLEAVRATGTPRIVYASSLAAVGRTPPPVRVDSWPRPVTPYGAAKLASEGYLRAYAASYGFGAIALRIANAYGPRSAHKPSVVHAFIRAVLAGQPVVIHGDGRQTRDFVHVDDLAGAVLAAIDAPPEALDGQAIPVGSGRDVAIADLAAAVFAAAGRPLDIEHRPARGGDVPRSGVDLSTARDLLGFAPTISLEDGIASTLDWYRTAVAS